MLRWSFRGIAVLVIALFAYEGYCVLRATRTLDARMAPFSPPQSALSAWQLEAIVKVQDPSFRTHDGIEWPSPLTTTTITQSLVKRIFFEDFHPGFQKLEQTLIATLVVNPRVSKDLQLHAFTKTAYFGRRSGRSIVGFDDAASTWFGSSLEGLTTDQFLSLLAMLPSPNTLTPGTRQAAARVERIKRLLASQCVHTRITEIQLEQCDPQ